MGVAGLRRKVENVYLPGDEHYWPGSARVRDSDHNYACKEGSCWHSPGDTGCQRDLYAAIRLAAAMFDLDDDY